MEILPKISYDLFFLVIHHKFLILGYEFQFFQKSGGNCQKILISNHFYNPSPPQMTSLVYICQHANFGLSSNQLVGLKAKLARYTLAAVV